MKLYYEINLTDIITQDEIAQEQALFEENYKQLQDAERETLAKYVEDNKINATPDEDGLYIVVNKKGKGNKVEIGRNVAINYTGRLLDGKIFDTSEVAFLPHALKKILEDDLHFASADKLINEWKEQGDILITDAGRTTHKVTIGEAGRTRAYHFKAQVLIVLPNDAEALYYEEIGAV